MSQSVKRRVVRIAAIGCVLALASQAANAFVLVVFDPEAWAKHVAILALQRKILAVEEDTYTLLRRMARRLSFFEPMDRFAASGAPPWRTWRGDAPSAEALAIMTAMNTGTGDPAAVEAVAPTRSAVDPELGLPPEVLQGIALLDMTDSAIVATVDTSGRVRDARRAEREAIAHLEAAMLDQDGSLGARLMLVSAEALVETRQKETRIAMLAAMSDITTVETIKQRQAAAATMQWQDAMLAPQASLAAGSADALTSWRQP